MKKLAALVLIIGCIEISEAYDTPHYYLATSLPNPSSLIPRIELDSLDSIDISIESGHAHKGFGPKGKRSSLLLDNRVPSRTAADFAILSTNICWTKNLYNGLFLQANLPIKTYSFSLSNPFLLPNPYKQIAEKKCIRANNSNQTGIGDITALVGFTQSNNATVQADFFDYTLQLGILIPTGKKSNPATIGSIPLGYNGKTALLATIIGAIGYFEWLTVGLFNEGVFFVTQKPTGPLIHIAPYIIADHFIRGLSFGASGSFINQFGPKNSSLLDQIPNHTNTPWEAVTVHLFTEYEFTQPNWKIGPRVGMGYHKVVQGKNIFNITASTISLGLDLIW